MLSWLSLVSFSAAVLAKLERSGSVGRLPMLKSNPALVVVVSGASVSPSTCAADPRAAETEVRRLELVLGRAWSWGGAGLWLWG